MWLIYHRYNHLLQTIIIHEENDKSPAKIIDRDCNSITYEDARWMHYHLFTAAKKINSIYSIQLSVWILAFIICLTTRLFILLKTEPIESYLFIYIYWLVISIYGLNLFIITATCHFTSRKANKITEQIFSVYSRAKFESNSIEHDQKASLYFYNKKLCFTSLSGLYTIDLPLLMSLIGASTTLLVLLVS
ncbi:hypothetical protein HCN44_006087 [Aphidius gifuensis]|uniref:Gustatory receptor n=1 Tax=Aphidius gifuensis TaxID=684658 RepID=A0A834Y6Q1_APHGI|nr:hypothetical protein HCN44_006087 [Aphidius gifuensis]